MDRVSRTDQVDIVTASHVERCMAKLEIALGFDRRSGRFRKQPNVHRAIAVLDGLREFLESPPDETPLEMLGLDSKSVGCLNSAGITSIEELVECSEDQLLLFEQMGPDRVNRIKQLLGDCGLSLRGE